MTNEDCLPNTICQECHKELERHYAFRKKCETSYQKLKSHVLAVREKEYNLKMAQQKEQSDMIQTEKDDEQGGSNLVFTINMDGTISVCENNVPSDVCLHFCLFINSLLTIWFLRHISTSGCLFRNSKFLSLCML